MKKTDLNFLRVLIGIPELRQLCHRENQELLPEQIQFEGPNASRFKDYFRLDFSSTYTFNLFKNVSALTGVSFLNVLGNDNVYNQFYSIGDEQNLHVFRQNGLGFTPNFVFRVRF